MKIPEFALRYPFTYYLPDGSNDSIEFPIGTLVRPFWNKDYIPEHITQELASRPNYSSEKQIVCLIGRIWARVPEASIRENR